MHRRLPIAPVSPKAMVLGRGCKCKMSWVEAAVLLDGG